MHFHFQSHVPTYSGFRHSRRETSHSPTDSSVWSMPVIPVYSPAAYRVHGYGSYSFSLSNAKHTPYPVLTASYPKSNINLPPFSTLLPKEDKPPLFCHRTSSHVVPPLTSDTPTFHQRDFISSTPSSSSSLRRPPGVLSSDLPFAKRRRADPESDQYLARLNGGKARCMFLLEHDPDSAGGGTSLCGYEARSDMVRRHIRAVHLKLK